MSIRRFTIKHDVALYGPFPGRVIDQIDKLSYKITSIDINTQKVEITVDNTDEEDMLVLAYELGSLITTACDSELY